MHMFYDGGYHMGGMHGLWWIFWIVLIGVIIFYGWGRSGDRRRPLLDAAQQALQLRLANGEITPDEYEKHKRLIERDARSNI